MVYVFGMNGQMKMVVSAKDMAINGEIGMEVVLTKLQKQ